MSTINAIGTGTITVPLAASLITVGNYATTFTFTAGTSVTFPTSGTLATTNEVLNKINVTGASATLASNTLYTINDASSLVTLTLPSTAVVGDVIAIRGSSSNGWTIVENSGQSIGLPSGGATTTTTGSLSSVNRYDCVDLTCIVTNTTFVASNISSLGLTVV